MKSSLLQVILSGILALHGCSDAARADELDDRLVFWNQQAFYCGGQETGFPSKHSEADPNACDDGDMTLFNGLLCASGDERGCRGVQLSQDADGRWWRSPRRIGWEAPAHDVSFSADQSRGVLLYAAERKDAPAFQRWLAWIEKKRPCLTKLGSHCIIQGWPRFCPDDQQDMRCTFRPWSCISIAKVAQALGVGGDICKRVFQQFGIGDLSIPYDVYVAGSAVVNSKGYPMHLAGVDIFLLRQIGLGSDILDEAARILARREPENPFFAYLAEGSTPRVREIVLNLCPAPDRRPRRLFQWSWERAASEQAWKDSMYWDCIFIGNLLKASKHRGAI